MTEPASVRRSVRRGLAISLTAVVVAGCSALTGVSTTTPGKSGVGNGCPTSAPPALAAGSTRTVTITTSKGTFAIQVRAELSPLAAGNFVALASCGFYTGVVFHRIVPGFVIQGGDPGGTGAGGPGYTIKDEPVSATYGRGVVAMARSRQPESQASQFFIVLHDAARNSLASANTYAIFGTVVSGMETVDAIAAGPRTGPNDDQAAQPVVMETVTVTDP